MAGNRYDEVTVHFNAREIMIPLFRCGVAEYRQGALVEVWEHLGDWRKVVSRPTIDEAEYPDRGQ